MKRVVRLVVIEGGDDVIAIGPGIAPGLVFVEAVRFAVVHDVEPVAAPAFAITRRGEESVDQLLIGVGRVVGEEGVDFIDGGSRALKVICQTANESAAIGFMGSGESFFLESCEDERVNWSSLLARSRQATAPAQAAPTPMARTAVAAAAVTNDARMSKPPSAVAAAPPTAFDRKPNATPPRANFGHLQPLSVSLRRRRHNPIAWSAAIGNARRRSLIVRSRVGGVAAVAGKGRRRQVAAAPCRAHHDRRFGVFGVSSPHELL